MSFHGVVRRYVGGSGESWIGGGYSHGYSREELGDSAELAGTGRRHPSRQRRNPRAPAMAAGRLGEHQPSGARAVATLWQHSLGASVTVYL